MQRKKTREELLTVPYLSKTDIATLYGVPWAVAVRVFTLAKEAGGSAGRSDRIPGQSTPYFYASSAGAYIKHLTETN